MPFQREDVTALFNLAAAYDWESFQERLCRIELPSSADIVRVLAIVRELEYEDERKAAAAHMLAEDLLLRYIDQPEITSAFQRIHH